MAERRRDDLQYSAFVEDTTAQRMFISLILVEGPQNYHNPQTMEYTRVPCLIQRDHTQRTWPQKMLIDAN